MSSAPFIHVWRPQASPDVELLLARTGQHSAPVHLHDELEFGVAPAHSRWLQLEGRWHAVPPGALTVCLPGRPHATRSPAGAGTFYGLRIRSALLHEVWRQLFPGRPSLPDLPPIHLDPMLTTAVLTLHRRSAAPTGLSDEEISLALRLILTQLLRGPDTAPRPVRAVHSAVRAARAQLEDTPEAPVPLAELARSVGLSPSHFARTFQAATGQAPHAYLLGVRIRRAKTLLLGDEPLAQLAAQLGFASQSHFTQTFRRQVGVTPHRYRQDSKILIDPARPPRAC